MTPTTQSTPRNMASSAATIGGLAGLAGGALAIIGWFMPWSAIQGINGLQVTISAVTGGIAAFGLTNQANRTFGYSSQVNNLGGLLGCIGLVIAVAYGVIPIIGIACARTGLKLVELRLGRPNAIKHEIGTLKSRSTTGFVLMLTLYLIPTVLSAIIIALLPVLLLVQQLLQTLGLGLGGGYFVAGGGFVVAFVGALFARSQLVGTDYQLQTERPITTTSTASTTLNSPLPSKPAVGDPLTGEEQQVLELLAQGLPNEEIAARLNSDAVHVSLQTRSLLAKLGAVDTVELIKAAKDKGLIPTS